MVKYLIRTSVLYFEDYAISAIDNWIKGGEVLN